MQAHSPDLPPEDPRSTEAFRRGLAALADRAARGDDAAFEALHQRLDGGLRRFFGRRSGADPGTLDELASQTWTVVWQALRNGRYDPTRSAFTTYLYAVGYKIWLQHRRQRSRAALPLDGLDEFVAGEDSSAGDPSGTIALAELIDAVRDCLDQATTRAALTLDERQIVEGVIRGATERELARTLNIAASTVNARKQSAYKKLAACLRRKGFELDAEQDRAEPQ